MAVESPVVGKFNFQSHISVSVTNGTMDKCPNYQGVLISKVS